MVKIYTKKIKKNNFFFRTRRIRRKPVKKQKGGANCPEEGFRQHLGECWNDSMMMNLCYSNGIGDRIQAFFDGVNQIITYYKTKTKTKTKISYLNSDFLIRDFIKKYTALPGHKEEYKHLLPLNVDNPIDYETFIENAIIYIQEMYTRYQNKKEHPLVRASQETHQKSLNKMKSFDSSIACVKANFAAYNINKKIEKKFSIESHGGTETNSIITLCMINYCLINLQLPAPAEYTENVKDLVMKEAEAKDRTFINFNYVEILPYFISQIIKNQIYKYIIESNPKRKANAKNYILDILSNNNVMGFNIYIPLIIHKYKKAIELLSNYTSLLLNISYVSKKNDLQEEGGHAVSFFKCNDKLKYYNNNHPLRLDNLDVAEKYHTELLDNIIKKVENYERSIEFIKTKKEALKKEMDSKKKAKLRRNLKQYISLINKTQAIHSYQDDFHLLTGIGGLELKEFNTIPFFYQFIEYFCQDYDEIIILKNVLRNMYVFFERDREIFKKGIQMRKEDIIKWGDLFINLFLYAEKNKDNEEIAELIFGEPYEYKTMFSTIFDNEHIKEYMILRKQIYPSLPVKDNTAVNDTPLSPWNETDVSVDEIEISPDTDEEDAAASAAKRSSSSSSSSGKKSTGQSKSIGQSKGSKSATS